MSDIASESKALQDLLKIPMPLEDRVLLLLKLFIKRKPNEKLTSTWSQRKSRIEANKPRWNDSLKYAAIYWKKDQRTIRRWCEKGVFKRARRTKGGQWRIPQIHVKNVDLKRLAKLFRQPKTVFGLKASKDMDGVFWSLRQTTKQAQVLDEISRGITGKPVSGPFVSDDALDISIEDPKRIRIQSCARKLALDSGHVEIWALAKAMGISRATLYRRYGPKMIRSAIQKANVKVRVIDQDEPEQDSLTRQVAKEFEIASHLHEKEDH